VICGSTIVIQGDAISLYNYVSSVRPQKLTGPLLVKKFLALLWVPKVHYLMRKRPPPVPILNRITRVHAPHSTSWRPILIVSSLLYLSIPGGLFPISHSNPCTLLPCLPCVPHVPPIFDHPISLLTRTYHKAPRHVVFSIPLLPCPSQPQISFSAPVLEYPRPMFLPQFERPSFSPIRNNTLSLM